MRVKRFLKKGYAVLPLAAIFLTLLFMAATPGISLAQAEYVLGEDDLLNVTVYENDDLATLARINGDNKIAMPLIGEINVGGLTVRKAEQEIAARLADGFLLNPSVSIFVKEYHSKKVTILGEVDKPGLYELSGNATLLEIISQAGGLTDKAGSEALVKRVAGPEGSETYSYLRLNLRDLTEKGNLSGNIAVKDKDSIFITKSGFIYVTGQVAKPGAFKYEGGMTVMKAIALAEGLTDKAAPGGTEIIRKKGDTEESIKGEMSTQVQPEDLVSVPESFSAAPCWWILAMAVIRSACAASTFFCALTTTACCAFSCWSARTRSCSDSTPIWASAIMRWESLLIRARSASACTSVAFAAASRARAFTTPLLVSPSVSASLRREETCES